MKPLLTLVAALFLAAAVTAVAAKGDGSPYTPGLVQGAEGVVSPDHRIRFVTLATAESTVVAAIRVRTGRVVRSNVLRGFYGVPIVAWDNSTGGVSADGRTLVVGSYGPLPGDPGVTRFAVLRTDTLRQSRVLALRGSWAYDAISPDGSRMFLIEYLAAGQNPRYRVRSLDMHTGRLDPDAVVDRREDEVLMRGQPVTRVTSQDGGWAYTLYARPKHGPFVHALDTVRGEAYCVDLPVRLRQLEQMALRLRMRGDGALEVRNRRERIALVDTGTLELRG
ncbi:MAG TPA: hypothetical protein VFT94_01530 [Gaiellaceae bacterium]|nr:hypothetical protein [Gaiellaceae bacterium]